ncbi:phosphohydrolase [Natrarchaeobius halalkaliphilus]
MPEVTISDRLYEKLEEQSDDAVEDALWELMYHSHRDY